ncbi:MAG TPA: DUF3016 domain-containing protein [Verrucomicrobiota bacterium]|nr:DUF3016 domain-containing protein [Verrucomicrobiota bacterium]
MKASLRAALAALLLATGCASNARDPAAGGSATVQFSAPERFLDFEAGGSAPAAWEPSAAELERFIQARAREVIPAGQTLELTITDVDLPGRIHRGARNLRVMDSRGSSEVRFDFRLLAADGRVLHEGSERLVRNPAQGSVSTRSDPSGQRVIQEALGLWMRRLVKETSGTAPS